MLRPLGVAVLTALAVAGAAPSVPAAGPSAGRLAFASSRAHGDLDIYVAGADASAPVRVTRSRLDELSPTWSPDGRRIAYRVNPPRSDEGDIWSMDATGHGKRNLTRTPTVAEWSPAWSPDGTRIAYFSDAGGVGDIWVMRPDGSDRRNLTADAPPPLNEYPTWSPDGARIAFNSHRDGQFEIYVMNADGSGARNLSRHSARDEWPSWSPDGRLVAFMSERDGNSDIFVVDPDGGDPANVTRTPEHEDFPAWTPDGRLGFVCESGLCTARVDGSDRKLLAAGELAFPAWTAAPAALPAAEPEPSDGVMGVLEAWETAPLVAFGEDHHNDRQHAFLRSLVAHPGFTETVDDVVVEFGNARYQRLVDRWVLNRRPGVSLARVRRAWMDTTQGSAWSGSLYEGFFRAVRAANMRVPPAKRVRLLLGDPPIDWSKIRTNAQYERWIARRNTHYVSVVERLVLARGRRALLIAGSSHLLRSPIHDRNETGMLDARHRGSVYVVLPETRVLDGHDEIEQPLRTLPAPSLVPLARSWLGASPAAAFLQDGWDDGTLAERADAFLVLGGP